MKMLINKKAVKNLKPQENAYDVYDSKLTGLVIRVNPSGKMSYVCQYTRGRRITIGQVELMTAVQARDKVTQLLSDYKRGIPIGNTKSITLRKFIIEHYQPWALTHLKSHKMTLRRITRCFFKTHGSKKIDDITIASLEKWRAGRLNSGVRKETVNRDIAGLKAAISKAYEWGYCQLNIIAKMKLLKVDPSKKIRFFSREEEFRIRSGLDQRESKLKKQRESANQWRQNRNYPFMPKILESEFADHLKPMILLSINTGIRQGELFQLKWVDVDFDNAVLKIGGEYTKNKKTRYHTQNSLMS